ncbi:hypothetical protein ARMGADRAFT_1130416, partial [Armillaria gallica]
SVLWGLKRSARSDSLKCRNLTFSTHLLLTTLDGLNLRTCRLLHHFRVVKDPLRNVKKSPPTPISHLPGTGRYALDSYSIFCTTYENP